MRSLEIRSDIMSVSTGTGRYNTDWELAAPVQIPWVPKKEREAVANKHREAWKLEQAAASAREAARGIMDGLGLNSEVSRSRFDSYKPPR